MELTDRIFLMALYATDKHLSIFFISLRDVVTAGSDGDSITDFDLLSYNVTSDIRRVFLRCLSQAEIKIAVDQ